MRTEKTSPNLIWRLAASAALISALIGAPAEAQNKRAKGKPTVKATATKPAPTKVPAPAPTTPSAVLVPDPVPTAPTTPKAGDERVDISDIENKYWAPKDTDFSVVQNRTYSKEKRLAFSAQYGPLINDNYNEGNSTALALNYFFSERTGLQLDYVISDYRDSDIVNRIQALNASPDYGRVTGYYGIGFNVIPFYAKMSFLGSKIIYFDMAITPTVGMTSYETLTLDAGTQDKTAFTYGFDLTQWFFLYKHFAIRVDIKNRWFSEEVVKYQTDLPVRSGTKLRDNNTDNTLFLIGGTLFF